MCIDFLSTHVYINSTTTSITSRLIDIKKITL
nr:MAG TPA: ms48, ms51, ms56, ms59, ms60, translation, Trypanosoma, large ribosomal [Caudoviricetes sp.]